MLNYLFFVFFCLVVMTALCFLLIVSFSGRTIRMVFPAFHLLVTGMALTIVFLAFYRHGGDCRVPCFLQAWQ